MLNRRQKYILSQCIQEEKDFFPKAWEFDIIRAQNQDERKQYNSPCLVSQHRPWVFSYAPFLRGVNNYKKTLPINLEKKNQVWHFLILHEFGHLRHEQLTEYWSEQEIIKEILSWPKIFPNRKDGWKDIFADYYALYRLAPNITPEEVQESFKKLLEPLI